LRIPNEKLAAVNKRRTDNAMVKRKWTKDIIHVEWLKKIPILRPVSCDNLLT
jgi:hypothetical protein